MALVAHTIVSRYTPQQRESATHSNVLEDDPWQTESSFGAAQRLHSRAAPYFVAASLEYDEYGMPRSDAIVQSEEPNRRDTAEDVSAWYRSVTSKCRSRRDDVLRQPLLEVLTLSSSPSSTQTTPEPYSSRSYPPHSKTNWFTSRSRTADSPGPLTQHTSKPSAFADLLSRNPPPLPSEPSFKPPIFLTLGPGNKGFTMLQRKGWREGEGLGSARVERRPSEGFSTKRHAQNAAHRALDTEEHKPIIKPSASRFEDMHTSLAKDPEREVIDLTLSDSETPKEYEFVDLTSDSQSEPGSGSEDADELLETNEQPHTQPHGTTLLTPIATTLKADRLGIGLKARRHPSTTKAKAVTHTSFALAVHIRSSNKMRKEKARHGRGSRGFARSKRKEEKARVEMLAYMNS